MVPLCWSERRWNVEGLIVSFVGGVLVFAVRVAVIIVWDK